MQVACENPAHNDTVATVSYADTGSKRQGRLDGGAVAYQARIVKLVTAKLRSTGQKRVLGVDACFDVSVRLVMPGLLDLDGQCADHRVALTLADKGSRKIHEPAALSPHREPLGDPGREGCAELCVGC